MPNDCIRLIHRTQKCAKVSALIAQAHQSRDGIELYFFGLGAAGLVSKVCLRTLRYPREMKRRFAFRKVTARGTCRTAGCLDSSARGPAKSTFGPLSLLTVIKSVGA